MTTGSRSEQISEPKRSDRGTCIRAIPKVDDEIGRLKTEVRAIRLKICDVQQTLDGLWEQESETLMKLRRARERKLDELERIG